MLEYLRNVSEKPLAKVLIALLAFSFIGWGVAEWILGGAARDTTLVTVGGEKISMQQYSNEKSRTLANMTREEQRATYADSAKTNALSAQVLATIITQQMVQNRANDLGFVVSDHRVAREIREMSEFQQNGQFSSFLFNTVLNQSGLTEEQFASILRGQIMRSMTLGALSAPMSVPQFAINAAYNARYATRDIEYATVKVSDFKVANPSDDELKTFYAQNPHTVPETRAVSYVLVPADMGKPDEYDAKYAIALKVEDDIIAGENMEATAKKHDAKYISIKPFAKFAKIDDKIITDDVMPKVFDMAQGEDSELMETKDGFVIIHIDAVNPEHNAEFETVKKNLIADWKHDRQTKDAYIRANELLVDLNNGKKLSGAKSVSVSRTSGAPMAVLSGAFNNALKTNTIIPTDDAFYVLSVKSEKMPKADTKKTDELRKEMQESALRGLRDDYNEFLKRKYPTKINKKVYDRFFEK